MAIATLLRLFLFYTSVVVIGGLNVTFRPQSLDNLLVGETGTIELNVTCETNSEIMLRVDSEDDRIVKMSDPAPVTICARPEVTNASFNVSVEARFIGKVNIRFRFTEHGEAEPETTRDYRVTVVRVRSTIMKVFIIVTATLMVILNVGFGSSIDLDVIKEILQKPVAPAIGALCQFLVMPLVCVLLLLLVDLCHVPPWDRYWYPLMLPKISHCVSLATSRETLPLSGIIFPQRWIGLYIPVSFMYPCHRSFCQPIRIIHLLLAHTPTCVLT